MKNVRENMETVDPVKQLLEYVDVEARKIIAISGYTAPELLAILAKDDDVEVRGWVAYNKNTPADVINFLSKDEEEFVRASVASNRVASPEILAILANDIEGVRRSLTWNVGASVETLSLLARDESAEVRRLVAANPKLPGEVLLELVEDPVEAVREAAIDGICESIYEVSY